VTTPGLHIGHQISFLKDNMAYLQFLFSENESERQKKLAE
jgi:hypothetical protein